MSLGIWKNWQSMPNRIPVSGLAEGLRSAGTERSPCLDDSSEYLTRKGWVAVYALEPTDKVAEYWPEQRSIDFVSPAAISVHDYCGDMISLQSERLDLLLTPEHRCLLRKRSGRVFEIAAEHFAGDYEHVVAGTYAGGSKSLSSAQIAWLIAVQADGHVGSSNQISFHFSKVRKYVRLKNALDTLGIHEPTYHESGGHYQIYVSHAQNPTFVEWTLSLLGRHKEFGPWLLQLDRATLDLFGSEIFAWDGNFRQKDQVTCAVSQNMDWVQIVKVLAGLRARKGTVKAAGHRSDSYYVSTPPKRRCDCVRTTFVQKTAVPYIGKVYCVTVPSSWIIVRRNGIVSITGDSKAAPHQP